MADISAPPLAAPPLAADAAPNGAPVVAPAPVVPINTSQQPAAPQQPEFVSETLYIQNLNEKIKIPVLKASLRGLFKSYGEVLDVVAHSNLRMRGQAFVSFESADIAQKALKEVKGFPPVFKTYGTPTYCFILKYADMRTSKYRLQELLRMLWSRS